MSANNNTIITRAAAACTALGYAISSKIVNGVIVPDYCGHEYLGQQINESYTTKIYILDSIPVVLFSDKKNQSTYKLSIVCATRNNESDNYTAAASMDNCETKFRAFLDKFLLRGTLDNFDVSVVGTEYNRGFHNNWTVMDATVTVTVTNC